MIVGITYMYMGKRTICYPRDLNHAINCVINAHKCMKCRRKSYLIYFHYPDYYITMECGAIYRLKILNY